MIFQYINIYLLPSQNKGKFQKIDFYTMDFMLENS